MALSSRAAWPALKFWLIDEKWRLYTAGRRGKQGSVAIGGNWCQLPAMGQAGIVEPIRPKASP
jgi:hypothetical protein